MNLMKTLSMALALLWAIALTTVLANPAWAAAAEPSLEEGEGTIHAVEIDSNTLVINGVRFRVAYDAQVEIRGSYGAFTMLQPGMKVTFEYRRYSPVNLEIFDIEQLPDNAILEET